MKWIKLVLLFLVCSVASADEDITLTNIHFKTGLTVNHPSTIYLDVTNKRDELDYLLAVNAIDNSGAKITINKTVIEKNIARIIKIDRLAIPGNSTIKLSPLGIFLVINNDPALKNFTSIKLEFVFAKSKRKVILL